MICVFVGPSLPAARVQALLQDADALVLPPAAQGDIYRAARRMPAAIGLVDGYFGEAPAVWHKEILWTLKQGIPVLGAASMGALRAAELAAFGMVGIGAIFAAYRDGELVDDDEVALCHAPAELGYVPLSEPLVNIRATLAAALQAGVVDVDTHDAALRVGRAIHYPQRSWDELLQRLPDAGYDGAALRAWLPAGRVDQKALDAEALLRAIVADVPPPRVDHWHFEHTAMWDELVRVSGQGAVSPSAVGADRVFRQLETDRTAWWSAMQAGMARLLATDAARREGKAVSEDELLSALEDLRRDRGLASPEAFQSWLDANDLDTDALVSLLANQVRLQWMVSHLQADLEPHVLDHLKLTGAYGGPRR